MGSSNSKPEEYLVENAFIIKNSLFKGLIHDVDFMQIRNLRHTALLDGRKSKEGKIIVTDSNGNHLFQVMLSRDAKYKHMNYRGISVIKNAAGDKVIGAIQTNRKQPKPPKKFKDDQSWSLYIAKPLSKHYFEYYYYQLLSIAIINYNTIIQYNNTIQ